ncbi:MAG: hypothetical protein FWF46_03645 [Oscillospiraceae bacterium]|nr:hypothetical protein [Oscillospiraceae bacterium]
MKEFFLVLWYVFREFVSKTWDAVRKFVNCENFIFYGALIWFIIATFVGGQFAERVYANKDKNMELTKVAEREFYKNVAPQIAWNGVIRVKWPNNTNNIVTNIQIEDKNNIIFNFKSGNVVVGKVSGMEIVYKEQGSLYNESPFLRFFESYVVVGFVVSGLFGGILLLMIIIAIESIYENIIKMRENYRKTKRRWKDSLK